MRKLWAVVHVGLEVAVLFLCLGVPSRIEEMRADAGVVIVHPLGEVIGELIAGHIGRRILKINDDELLVLVGGPKEWGLFIIWLEAQNIAILRLGRGTG